LYAAELWRHAYRYLGDRDGAEDIVQDVFVAVWERRAELVTGLAMRPYLFAAVRNHALKQLRHRAVVDRTERRDLERQSIQPSEVSESADAHATEAALTTLVRRALNELPERQRTAIELRWLRGLNHTEVAAILGVSEAAVRKLVTKALGRLECLHRRLQEP
jgi:RNA polymerase sigma-70 factor (ECF subfamily)